MYLCEHMCMYVCERMFMYARLCAFLIAPLYFHMIRKTNFFNIVLIWRSNKKKSFCLSCLLAFVLRYNSAFDNQFEKIQSEKSIKCQYIYRSPPLWIESSCTLSTFYTVKYGDHIHKHTQTHCLFGASIILLDVF